MHFIVIYERKVYFFYTKSLFLLNVINIFVVYIYKHLQTNRIMKKERYGDFIKILTENNRLLREHTAMNSENEKLSNNSILQINSNNQFIDRLKDCKLPEIKKFNIIPVKVSVDRCAAPFNSMTINELKNVLRLKIQSEVSNNCITFQERIENYEASILLCIPI